jgi:hypothetical protein
MAGQIVDAQSEFEDDDSFSPVDQDKEQLEEATSEPQETEEKDEVEDLPDKYKGKSFKDLIQMHQEAEKAIGKQGNEVGELRKLVDEHIRTQLEQRQSAPKQEPEEEPVDWFTDPDKAFDQRINNHPKIKEAEATVVASRKTSALQQLKANHPDMDDILADPQFAAWVKAKRSRQELFVRADQQYDYEAADDLFSTYKEIKGARVEVNRQAEQVDKELRKEQVKQATTGAARGTNPPARKKKYRRADIMKLRQTDPERYNQLADEFLLAYREGRVV